jgi:hypothetical protein
MRNIFTFLILCGLVFAGYTLFNGAGEEKFALSGTVTVPERLAKAAHATNNTCSIIVKNEADVPIAIKRVINPSFPLEFSLDKSDLLISEWAGNVKLEVEINNHGNLGVLKAGDIFGAAAEMVPTNAKNIVIEAGKMTGVPKFASNRGNSFFRTAAR